MANVNVLEIKIKAHLPVGKSLADAPRTEAAAVTAVFDNPQHAADRRVERIIAAHLGRKTP